MYRAWKFQTDLQVRYFKVKDRRILALGTRAFRALKINRERALNVMKMNEMVVMSTKRHILFSWYKLLSNKLRGQLRMAKRR